MSGAQNFDGQQAEDTRKQYQTKDIIGQRRAVLDFLELQPGDHVLDIGSGPGLLLQEMAEIVGLRGRICGLDVSEDMVEMARQQCLDFPQVYVNEGGAEKLPYPDASFDAVVMTQVLEYVADPMATLREIYRVLKPGGRVVILDTDWGSVIWNTEDRDRMARVLRAWDEHLEDPWLPQSLIPKLRQAGLTYEWCRVFPLVNTVCDTSVYSYWLVGFVEQFVVGRQGITLDEARAWASELKELHLRMEYFFSLNRYLFLARKE